MSLPTVASLRASVPAALIPAAGFDTPDHEVSAVHVSELIDPTAYLSGGELLLTTGLSMPDNDLGFDRYVARLRSVGISALGIGLGPSLSTIPEALAAACMKHGLCLLIVPPEAAFLTVTKAYWSARSLSTQQELTDAISSHRSLVDAMVSKDPVGATLKALSRAIGAWVARLSPSGAVEDVFPSAKVSDAMSVADQISTLQVAGIHSSATFPLGDDVVAVFPLPLEDRVVGYIAIGSSEPMGATARRLVLTAGALLSLDSVQRQRADAAVQSQMQAVTSLLDMGFVEPARRLAVRMGLDSFGGAMRVLVVRSARASDVTEAIQTWMPEALPGIHERGISWFVLPEIHPDLSDLSRLLTQVDTGVAAALSDCVDAANVHQVRVGLFENVVLLDPGSIDLPHSPLTTTDDLRDGMNRVLGYTRADLTQTLVAYLRHRGHWDRSAREVAVHRNTMRHRMVTVQNLLGADPDNPDVAAELWLYLRRNGLATSGRSSNRAKVGHTPYTDD